MLLRMEVYQICLHPSVLGSESHGHFVPHSHTRLIWSLCAEPFLISILLVLLYIGTSSKMVILDLMGNVRAAVPWSHLETLKLFAQSEVMRVDLKLLLKI